MKTSSLLAVLIALSAGLRAETTRRTTGEATRTENGVDWNADHLWTGPNGATGSAHTTGQGRKTENGRAWDSTTTGTGPRGETFTREGTGTATKNGDGTVTIQRDWTRSTESGKTVTGSSETVVTRGEDGKSWESTGTINGPRGTSQFTGSGSATRTENGTSWSGTRSGEGPKGGTWSAETRGQSSRTENGRTWTSETSRDRERAEKPERKTRENKASRSRSGGKR